MGRSFEKLSPNAKIARRGHQDLIGVGHKVDAVSNHLCPTPLGRGAFIDLICVTTAQGFRCWMDSLCVSSSAT